MSGDADEATKEDQWGKVPGWILDTDRYLPAYYARVPEDQRRKGDDKPLNGGELRTYLAMRTFAKPNGRFKAYVRTIADRACVDKSTVERAIGKFKRLGWVTTQQHRRDDGSIHLCDYVMRNTCPTPEDWGCPPVDGGVPVSSRVGCPGDDGRGTRELTGVKNRPDEQTKESEQRSEVQCRTSARFAPGGAGQDDEPNQVLHLDTTPQPRTGWDDWRQRDYDLFLDVLDATHVRSLGGKAGAKGTVYTAAALYDAMQRLPGGGKSGKDWPGRYLETVNVGESGAGVDSWLARHDLERA